MDIRNKRIVVTGGTGHIGRNLIKRLDDLKANVVVFYRNKKKFDFSSNAKFVHCEISKKSSVEKNRKYLNNADFLVHMAAFVPKYKDDLLKSVSSNIIGSVNLANNISGQTKVIYISTAEVYGNVHYTPIDEKHPCNPVTYYGASKLIAEQLLSAILSKNKNNFAILRFASVYGPGEIIDRAIPNFINSVINNKSPIIYGDGSDKRDYQYIDDAVESILCALKHFKHGTYNIASGRSYTIKQIADTIIKISDKNIKPIFKKREKQKNDFVFDISNSRKLGFIPKIDIEYGLKKEMIWRIIGEARKIYIDVDGTIFDVIERSYRLHKDSIEYLGLKPFKKEDYIKLKKCGKSEKSIIEKKYKINVFNGYNKIRMNNIEKERYLNFDKLIPKSIEALKKLKINHNIFLVTNRKSKRLFFEQIRKFRLTGLFDGVSFSRDNLSGKESVIIGDSEEDVLTAKKLKWKVIAVESGLRNRDFLSNLKPDLIIKDI